MRQSGHLSCCSLTYSMQLGQKRWWPHRTRASRVSRCATKHTSQMSFCCGTVVVVQVAVGFMHKSTVSSNVVACSTQELYAGVGAVAPTVARTSWNSNSMWLTGRSGNSRALFVRIGISQSHFLHALNNCLCKMEPRRLRSLCSPALFSIRSNHLLIFHQTLHTPN